MNKNIYYKLGNGFRKYWWVFIIVGMTSYFWPQDHFKNCLDDYQIEYGFTNKDKALKACSRAKQDRPYIFKELKGKVFTNSSLFKHDGSS